jgi:hypothetical protein
MSDVGASPLAPLVGGGTVPGVVTCAAYAAGRRVADLALDEIQEVLGREDGFVWIGLYEPDEALLRVVQRAFGLHDLAIEDAVGCVNSIPGHRGSRGSEPVRVRLPGAPRVGQAHAAEGSRRSRVHAPSRIRLRRGAAPAFGSDGSPMPQDGSPVSAPQPRCALPRWGIRPGLRLGGDALPTSRGHPQARHVSSGRGRTAPPRRPTVGL